MQQIQISAVIPAYNRANILGMALDSIFCQQFAPAEVIVVDDGSTDGTRQLVERYGTKVRYVFQPNSGVSAARNRGVREANFPWIAFLDSDDCWLPQHLRRIASAIERTHAEAALYFCDTQQPAEDGGSRYWELCGLQVSGDFEFRRDAGDWALAPVQPMMLQASVIRRATYLQLGGLPEGLRTREDTLLFFKLALLHPVCAVAGGGTLMSSSDSIRLTHIYDFDSLVFWTSTICLYQELVHNLTIGEARRRFLTDCLSASHFCMARACFRKQRHFSAAKHMVFSLFISPSVFFREFAGSCERSFLNGKIGNNSNEERSVSKV